MKLIVGLGNPDKKYNQTRHNIGFDIVDYIYDNWLSQENFDQWGKNSKLKAEVAIGRSGSEKIILAKPTTYMNESGQAVQAIQSYFKIEPQDIIVIHDELDLLLGKTKIQFSKSSAGHNGVSSIIKHLGTEDFTRIRVGIARENKEKQGPGAKYVLSRFNILEKFKLRDVKKEILSEIKRLVA